MKNSAWYFVALLMLLSAFACSRPAEETPQANSAAPAAAPADAPKQPAQPAASAAPKAPAPTPAPAPAPVVSSAKIPAGTTVTVAMIDAVGTDTSKAGDTFTASLAEPIVVNGKTVLAKGTKVRGRVENVDEPGRVKGRAAITLVLTQIVANKQTITTEPFKAEAEPDTKKDALKVGAGAAVGAVVGAIAGGKKGAAIGAAVGGGTGTGVVLATKGDHIRLDSETKVNFVLKNDVNVGS